MTALYVILGILLFFFLIGQIRVGAMMEYDENGFAVKLKVAAFWFALYPRPEKDKKPRRKKAKKEKPKSKEAAGEPEPKKKGGALGLILELVPEAVEAVGVLFRKIGMDILVLHLTWAAEDPASAAMGYGAANAVMGAIYHPLDRAFRIKKSDIDISVDFEQKKPSIYAKAALAITLGQIVTLVIHYGYKALRIWMKRRKTEPDSNTKKEATAHE